MGEISVFQGDQLLAFSVATGNRSASGGYLWPPEADLIESRQITYLDPERPFWIEKFLNAIVSRLTTPECLESLQTNFSKYHQIAYLSMKRPISAKKKF